MVIFFWGGGVSYFFIVRVSPPAVGNDPSFEISSSKIVMKIVQSLIEIYLVVLAMDNRIFTHELSFICFSLNLFFIHLSYLYIRTLGLNKLDFPVQKRWICCTKFGWYFSNDSGDKCIIFNVVKIVNLLWEICIFS